MALWIRGHGGQPQQHVEDGGQLDPAPRSHNIAALEELETVNCHFMDDRLHSSILALPSAISIMSWRNSFSLEHRKILYGLDIHISLGWSSLVPVFFQKISLPLFQASDRQVAISLSRWKYQKDKNEADEKIKRYEIDWQMNPLVPDSSFMNTGNKQ